MIVNAFVNSIGNTTHLQEIHSRSHARKTLRISSIISDPPHSLGVMGVGTAQ